MQGTLLSRIGWLLVAALGAAAVGGVVQVITRRASAPQSSVGVGTQGTRLASAAAGTRVGGLFG